MLTWPSGEVNVRSASGSHSNSLPGRRARAGTTVASATNNGIAVLPNRPPDMRVSRCKFWPLDCGTGCKVQHRDLGLLSGMDKMSGFRHDRMDQAPDAASSRWHHRE